MRFELIRMEHIMKYIDHGSDLSDVNFDLYEDEIHAVFLRDPLTRKTLTDIMKGKLRQDSGFYYLYDKLLELPTLGVKENHDIYSIMEKPHLISGMSIAENLFLTDKRYYTFGFANKKLMNMMASDLLYKYNIYHIAPTSLAGNLKVADAHLIELIKYEAMGAKIIILNNVFEQYSEKGLDTLMHFLSILKENLSIVLLCEKYSPIIKIADRATLIHKGSTIVTLEKNELNKETILQYYNITEKNIKNSHANYDKKVMVFENVSDKSNLIKKFSLEVNSGEVLGFFDDDWRYSQTIIDLLFNGKGYNGNIYINQQLVNLTSKENAIKNGIVLVKENTGRDAVFHNMSLADNITIMMKKPLYNKIGIRNDRIKRFMANEVLKMIHGDKLLEKYKHRKYLPMINKHHQTKIVVAKWLCLNPNIMVFINPFLNFDDFNINELYRMIDSLCKRGIGVLIFSISRTELNQLSDRVFTFDDGEIIPL